MNTTVNEVASEEREKIAEHRKAVRELASSVFVAMHSGRSCVAVDRYTLAEIVDFADYLIKRCNEVSP